MATTNPTLTEAWSKIVDDTSEFLVTLPFSTNFSIEVAARPLISRPAVFAVMCYAPSRLRVSPAP